MRFIVILSMLCTAYTLLADRVVLKDGQVITGTIVEDTPGQVVITRDPDSTVALRRSFARSAIAEVVRDAAPTGVTYLEIPLIGTIGEEVTARGVREALAVARETGASYAILLIDSPGGMVSELSEIVEVLAEYEALPTVAFVKRGHSAAALVAGACDTIVMYPGAQMGAAAPYAMEDGVPKAVNAKVTAQVQAIARRAAKVGGHEPLFFEAMVDPDLELWIADAETKRVTSTRQDAPCLKPAGAVLMLGDTEAVQWQVAASVCRNYGELRRALGIETWTARSTRGRAIMARHAEQHRAAAAEQQSEEDFRRQAAEYRETAIPELQQLRQRITDATAALEANREALKVAKEQRDWAVARINAGVMPPDEKDPSGTRIYLNRSVETDRVRIEVAEQAYAKRVAEITQAMDQLTRQITADRKRAQELVDAAPQRP